MKDLVARFKDSVQCVSVFNLVLLLSLTLCGSSALAQSGASSIQGTVTDPSGAVVIDATINALNQATGVTVSTRTNNVGFYQVPGLNTGIYVVSVSAPNMKTYNRTIQLLVGQTFVADGRLIPGAVSQQVTVSGATVQLEDTTSGTISSTLENARINELPMNSRNLISLVNEVTPGLEPCTESASCGNGQEAAATEYEVDGATLTDRQFGGVREGQSQMVDPDAVQEVQVEDVNGGAQFAAPTTVVLNTKSGTNQLHGALFETARNNDFGIARTRDEISTYAQPQYIRNEFGASVGGPIVIPHLYHGKDKSFFFFAFERYSLAQILPVAESSPTVAMRNGDYSQALSSAGILQELYDPTTTGTYSTAACHKPSSIGTAAPANPFCRESYTQEYSEGPGAGPSNCNGDTNCMPSSAESPLAKVLNEMTPLPTNGNNPLVTTNLAGLSPELQIQPQFTFRLDQVLNENNRAYVRYTQSLENVNIIARESPSNQPITLPATLSNGDVIPYGASGIESEPSTEFVGSLGFTHVFSPTFYSETVFSPTWHQSATVGGGQPSTDYEQEMGLPNNFGETGFPYIENIFDLMDGSQIRYRMTQNIYNVDENLTKTLGKHQLQFGGRYRFERFGNVPAANLDDVQFGDYATALSNPSSYTSSAASPYLNSGQLNADEFLGAGYSYLVNLQPAYQHIHDMEIDAYFQDNYRLRSNLTLNLGLRWEAHPAAWVGEGAMMNFDLKNDAVVTSGSLAQLESEGLTTAAIINNDELDGAKFETPAQAGMPPMLANNYNLNFSPRVGVAWQPFGKWGTVLRGGGGRYIYPTPIREAYRAVGQENPFTVSYSETYTSTAYTPHGSYMLLSAPNTSSSFNYNTANSTTGAGWPVMGVNTANIINSASVNAITPGIALSTLDSNDPPEFTDEADFTVEQPMKWGSLLRVSYVYTHGTNLNNEFFFNDHPSQYSWEIQEGSETPSSSASGAYNSTTGEGPYDNTTWSGGTYQFQKSGWSNYNALQAVYQKLYHSGSAWQIMYVWDKDLRTGGDYVGSPGAMIDPYVNYVNSYLGSWAGDPGSSTVTVGPADANSAMPNPPNLPPPPPTGTPNWAYYKALNRWENYLIDTNVPPQHIQFNGLIDFPFGRGKRWLGNANKGLNELVGGWQLAGAGSIANSKFAITSSNQGPTNPLKIYKKSAPITDCRSGVCRKGYEWFNGYIPPTAISGNVCAGASTTVVEGLPTSWAPYQSPMDTSCTATGHDTYFGDNDVAMSNVTGVGKPGASPQPNGTVIGYGIGTSNNDHGVNIASDPTNPYGRTALDGPMNWEADASLFKVFPIRESMYFRLNFDAFNVFNHQGLSEPSGSDGTVCTTAGGVGCSSANTGRQLQFTARFTF